MEWVLENLGKLISFALGAFALLSLIASFIYWVLLQKLNVEFNKKIESNNEKIESNIEKLKASITKEYYEKSQSHHEFVSYEKLNDTIAILTKDLENIKETIDKLGEDFRTFILKKIS